MKYFGFVFLLFTVLRMDAQQLQYSDQQLGSWLTFYSNTKFTKNLSMYAERSYRHYSLLPSIEQFIFRVGFFYRPDSSAFSYGAGIALLKSMAPEDEFIPIYQSEDRIWEQIAFRKNLPYCNFDLRWRTEQRLVDDKIWFRNRFRVETLVPLNTRGIHKNTLFLSTHGEIFLNTQDQIIDRFRYGASFGYMFLSNLQCRLGYMHEFNTMYNRKYVNFTFAYDVDLTKFYKKK
ncbi:MAG: DUF2490 domain-containing protein [Bacteroidetes bacterium]|nr:DUF2490 domain-containing protein [Bacteroidota bacterium]